MDLAELGRFELLAAAALARHGVCTSEAFKFIRKSLGMRATDLGAVLGVAPETISRWETASATSTGTRSPCWASSRSPRPEADRALRSASRRDRKPPKAIDLRRAS